MATEERNRNPLPRVNRMIPVSSGPITTFNANSFTKSNDQASFSNPQKDIYSNEEEEVETIPRRPIAPIVKKYWFKGKILN